MKRTFILDENVIHASLKGSEPARRLLAEIADNRHSIAVTYELSQRYRAIFARRRTSHYHEDVYRVINGMLYDTNRYSFVSDPLRDERHIKLRHRKDLFLVQIGCGTHFAALIVSEDKDTRSDLVGLGFQAISVAQALARARLA